jgi:argininosuccinate synthase
MLFKFKLNSKSVYKDAKDGWFNNDMEIRVDILFGSSNGAVSNLVKYLNVRQSDIKNEQWVSFNGEVVNWDKNVWGNAMKYSWLEDDENGSTKITYNWSSEFEDEDNGTTESVSYSAEVTIPRDLYMFGESVVEYCDNKNGNYYSYSTGRLTFEVR